MRTNKTPTTNEMTASEIFEQFEGKSCRIDVAIENSASITFVPGYLNFEANEDFEAANGTIYPVYDELTIDCHNTENYFYLGELIKTTINGNETELYFDNGVLLTIKAI